MIYFPRVQDKCQSVIANKMTFCHFCMCPRYSCNVGFLPDNGSHSERCMENGNWSNQEPLTCKSKLFPREKVGQKEKSVIGYWEHGETGTLVLY